MQPRRAVTILAGIVLLIGLAMSITSLSVGRGASATSCGTALDPRFAQAEVADIMATVEGRSSSSSVSACEDAISGRRTIAFTLMGIGAAGLLYIWLTTPHKTRRDEQDEAQQAAQ